MDRERLRKVLTLAEANGGAEALNALAAARRLLAREGLRLSDLAGPAAAEGLFRDGRRPGPAGAALRGVRARGPFAKPGATPDPAAGGEIERLRAMVAQRELELAEVRRALAAEREAQAEAWRRRESDWAARLAEAGAEKARALAALGALTGRLAAGRGPNGRSFGPAETGAAVPPRSARARREAGLALLRDPTTRDLANREIARRLGVSPQSVANWRRRLARETDAAPATETGRPHRQATGRLLSLSFGRRREGR